MDRVHCPNCDHQGEPKVKSSGGCLTTSVFFCCVILGFIIWPLLIVAVFVLIYSICGPKQKLCAVCGFTAPIPIEQWNRTHTMKTRSGEDEGHIGE